MEQIGSWVPLAGVMRLLGWGYMRTYGAALRGEMGAKQLNGRWYFRRAAVLKRVRGAAGERKQRDTATA